MFHILHFILFTSVRCADLFVIPPSLSKFSLLLHNLQIMVCYCVSCVQTRMAIRPPIVGRWHHQCAARRSHSNSSRTFPAGPEMLGYARMLQKLMGCDGCGHAHHISISQSFPTVPTRPAAHPMTSKTQWQGL